jgi:coatomer protein complex subunit gamma
MNGSFVIPSLNRCVKHIFPNHVVFQFNVTNNMEDTMLSDVTVEMESESWEEELIVP